MSKVQYWPIRYEYSLVSTNQKQVFTCRAWQSSAQLLSHTAPTAWLCPRLQYSKLFWFWTNKNESSFVLTNQKSVFTWWHSWTAWPHPRSAWPVLWGFNQSVSNITLFQPIRIKNTHLVGASTNTDGPACDVRDAACLPFSSSLPSLALSLLMWRKAGKRNASVFPLPVWPIPT